MFLLTNSTCIFYIWTTLYIRLIFKILYWLGIFSQWLNVALLQHSKFWALDPPEVIASQPRRELSCLTQYKEQMITHLNRKHSFACLHKTRRNRTSPLKWKKKKRFCNTTWVDLTCNVHWLRHKIKQKNKQTKIRNLAAVTEKFTTCSQTSFIFFLCLITW